MHIVSEAGVGNVKVMAVNCHLLPHDKTIRSGCWTVQITTLAMYKFLMLQF